MQVVQQRERGAEVVARDLIVDVQQSIRAWMDADRVLPADGSALLTALDQALAGQNGAVAAAPRAGLQTFIERVQALIEAGLLDATDGYLLIEAAATIGALRRSAAGTD